MKVIITRNKGGLKEQKEPQTLGVLTAYDGLRKVFECQTLEKPWLLNKNGVSCIPDGVYQVKKWYSEDAKEAGKNVTYNHFQIMDVKNRSGILIHLGNYVDQIHGCVLVGDHYQDMNKDGLLDIGNSKTTLEKMFNVMPDEFELTIISI
jgi:hypothetical protein